MMLGIPDFEPALGYTPENVTNKQSDLTPSATKYPVVDAVIAGLNLKANLALANFTNLQVGGKQVAAYEYGSNANGYWQKWFDKDGNVIKCVQTIEVSIPANYTSVFTLPVAFPTAVYSLSGAGLMQTAAIVSLGSNATKRTTTTVNLSAIGYLWNFFTTPVCVTFTWIKA